jgi:hypothetical protein
MNNSNSVLICLLYLSVKPLTKVDHLRLRFTNHFIKTIKPIKRIIFFYVVNPLNRVKKLRCYQE